MKSKEFIKKHKEIFLALAKAFIFALAIFLSFGVILGIKTSDSDYMSPGIKYHDNVVYSRFDKDYMLRDVLTYEHDGQIYFGRLVGMPGDTITTNASGNVFQNGHLVYEENVKYTSKRSMEVEITLSENEYFVICDDRSQNFDSRNFGPISSDKIKGKVIIILRRFEI